MTNGVLLVGRLMMAACFIPSALKRWSNISGFSFQLAAAGMPYPSAVATGLGLVEVFGPLALVLGVAPRVVAGILITALVLTTGALHRFWDVAGVAARNAEQAVFIANAGLVAGLLFYAVSGPGSWGWHALWRGAQRPAPSKKPARPRAQKPRRAAESEEFAEAA